MLEKLRNGRKIVGAKALLRKIAAGEVRYAYVAQDADLFISQRVREVCEEKRIYLVEVRSMKELGEACGVGVPTAAAGLLL